MRPTHAPKPFAANREFTDREAATARFRQAFDGSQPRDAYRVLNWYGVGGEGKSALSEELIRLADAIAADAPAGHQVARARVNLQHTRLRRSDEALLAIRLQLARTFGSVFPCFDTAYARHFVLTNPGIDIRDKHKELFKGENPVPDDLLDLSEGGIAAEVAGAVGDLVPGLNLLYRYGTRLSVRVREWFQRRGKTVLQGLDDLTADALMERLPTYLGADLCDHLAERAGTDTGAGPGARALIVIDTHEALWREQNLKDPVQGAQADAWLRRLAQDAPGGAVRCLRPQPVALVRDRPRLGRPSGGPSSGCTLGHRRRPLLASGADRRPRHPRADCPGRPGPALLPRPPGESLRTPARGRPAPDPTHFGARRSPEDPDLLGLRHVLAQQIGRQGRYREAESESEFRAVWKGYVRVLGPDHPNTLRTRYWLAKVLDGQARHAEADDLPAGLEAQLLARFPETHRWVLDLREHLRQRGRS